MSPLARLLGLVLPACSESGTAGLPVPQPLDFGRLQRDPKPNSALAGPAWFHPTPDIVTQPYGVPATQLIGIVEQVGKTQKRTALAASFPVRMQLWFVVRSRWMNFPDLLTAQAVAHDANASTVLLYSRSFYGYSDFGANRRRLAAWVAAIDAAHRLSVESCITG